MANESKTLLTQLQEAQATIASQADQIKALETAKADGLKAIEVANAQAADALKAKEVADGTLKAESEAHAKTKGELADATARLANPAFAEAAAGGTKGKGIDGGTAGGSSDGEVLTKAQALAEYNKLTDAKAKAAFRKQHWQALGLANPEAK